MDLPAVYRMYSVGTFASEPPLSRYIRARRSLIWRRAQNDSPWFFPFAEESMDSRALQNRSEYFRAEGATK